MTVTWAYRGDRSGGEALAEAVSALSFGDGDGRFWIATEAGVVRRIRADLIARGVPKESIVTRGYWRIGEANHPDHDYGDD